MEACSHMQRGQRGEGLCAEIVRHQLTFWTGGGMVHSESDKSAEGLSYLLKSTFSSEANSGTPLTTVTTDFLWPVIVFILFHTSLMLFCLIFWASFRLCGAVLPLSASS